MAANAKAPVEIQRQYYADTATRYEQMHADEADPFSLQFFYSILRLVDAQSVLDVGTATGRNLRNFKQALPHLSVCGVEPVRGLIDQAIQQGHADCGPIIQASGEALPFADASFDVVCEFAVLHHVPNPARVVQEMLRVARKAVFICDSNRFGQGSLPMRFLKLALYKAGLWGICNYIKTRGKGYQITEGDGLAYSYSVYDSLDQISRWADRVILVPAGAGKANSWFHPLLTTIGVTVCALRDSK